MPIIGLTDNIVPRFQRIGKLRKGGEKTGTGYGPDLDHFRFTSERPEVVEAFHRVYGENPRLIRVYLPHRELHNAFSSWCELWAASGLQHRCDGKTMALWRNGAKYERGEQPCTGGHEKNDPKNDAVGRLEVIVPELIHAGYVGYVTLETHSLHDILHISQVLQAVHDSRGDLRGVEFLLRREQETISTPGWGDRANDRSKVKKWLVKIEPAADWVRVQIESARIDAMSLDAPSTIVDGDTGEIIERPKLPSPAAAAPSSEGEPAGAPEASHKPAGKTNGNGRTPDAKPGAKAKTASIKVKMTTWNNFCKNFSGQYPHYLNEENAPDKFHIGAAAASLGFPIVTDENFEQVSTALIHYAQERHPAPA